MKTLNSGLRPATRGGFRSSTRRSNGRSWWANAARSASRTRASRSANDGLPDSVGPQHHGVDEEADHVVERGVAAARDRCARPRCRRRRPAGAAATATAACSTMNRLTCRSAASPRSAAALRRHVDVERAAGSTRPRGPGPVGGQRELVGRAGQRRHARTAVGPRRSPPAARAATACSRRTAPAGRAASGAAAREPRRVGARSGRRGTDASDHSSVAMWCSSSDDRVVSGPARMTSTRSGISDRQVEAVRREAQRSARVEPSISAQSVDLDQRHAGPAAGSAGSSTPSRSRTPCAATRAGRRRRSSAAPRASTSSAPRTRNTSGKLYAAPVSPSRSRTSSRCCADDSGHALGPRRRDQCRPRPLPSSAADSTCARERGHGAARRTGPDRQLDAERRRAPG